MKACSEQLCCCVVVVQWLAYCPYPVVILEITVCFRASVEQGGKCCWLFKSLSAMWDPVSQHQLCDKATFSIFVHFST